MDPALPIPIAKWIWASEGASGTEGECWFSRQPLICGEGADKIWRVSRLAGGKEESTTAKGTGRRVLDGVAFRAHVVGSSVMPTDCCAGDSAFAGVCAARNKLPVCQHFGSGAGDLPAL